VKTGSRAQGSLVRIYDVGIIMRDWSIGKDVELNSDDLVYGDILLLA
jgi:hypothetical protein